MSQRQIGRPRVKWSGPVRKVSMDLPSPLLRALDAEADKNGRSRTAQLVRILARHYRLTESSKREDG